MKKLYVTDLDGTLLNEEGKLSDNSIKTLQDLIDKNALISFVTARSLFTSRVVLDFVKFRIPIIILNGGAIYDTVNKKYLHINSIDDEISYKIFKIVNDIKILPFVIGIENNKEVILYKDIQNIKQRDFLKKRRHYNDKRQKQVNEFYIPGKLIMLIFIDTYEKIEKLKTILEEQFNDCININMYKQDNKDEKYTSLDITCKEGNKGYMVKKLSEILSVNLKNTIVFGDDLNDIAMFKVAGYSVAVNSDINEVNDLACESISDNDDLVVNYIKNDYTNMNN